MEAVLYLSETPQAVDVLQNIRAELTSAVRNALLQYAYDSDMDIELSFGVVHINSKGSVSQTSFNGVDVTDMDAFIEKQAFQINGENYYDIRIVIKNNIDDFCFYPIQIGNKVSFNVLKTSSYFVRKYCGSVHADYFRVEYASKYLIVYHGAAVPDVYYIGLFSPEATANTLLEKAGKSLGGKSAVYYCYMNTRPEFFLHIGQTKRDFVAYRPESNKDAYNFYKGSIICGIFRVNKKTDNNGKIKVKETKRECLQLIVKMQYGNVDAFCDAFKIDKFLFTAYLSGTDAQIKYTNGNMVTPTRLEELLNLPFSPDAESLKDKNLLIKVDYDEIPE